MLVWMFAITEWALILLIGFCGTLAFAQSGAYLAMHNFVLTRYPEIGHYFIWIIWGFLALIGFFSVIWRRKGGGRFSWFALIFAAPSILAFNKLDIPGLLGINLEITTGLALWQVLALVMVIITAYMLLNFMSELKSLRLGLIKKDADSADIQNVSVKSHQALLVVLLCALIASALIILIAVNLEAWLLPFFSRLPWNIIFIGIGCLLILAIYIYWLGTHHSGAEK